MSNPYSQNTCAKGPVPFCLEEMSKQPNARANLDSLGKAIEGLRSSNFFGLEKVFEAQLFQPTNFDPQQIAPATQSLEAHWFNENSPDAYFPDFQPIAQIYAEGVLKALELSLKGLPDPIPIESWWVMGFSRVEMINLATSRQITLLIATPAPPVIVRKMLGSQSEVWISGLGIVTRRL